MTLQRQIDQLMTHRASEWFEVLKAGRAHEHEAFVKWITESPRHVAEFLAMVALDRELRSLDLKGRFDLDALLRKAAPRVTEFRSAPPSPPLEGKMRRFGGWKWAAGIAALALIFGIWLMPGRSGLSQGQSIATAVGEQRSIELPDGSVVYVNAQSSVRVELSGAARDVRLLRGEALFKVAHDARRPFRVHTHDAIVQALGTQFNVYTRDQGTAVAVLEGKVQISIEDGLAKRALSATGMASAREPAPPAAIVAGQAVQISPTGEIERNAQADVLSAVAWRQRRLVFEKTPLEDVVREFNRYNKSVRLRLVGVSPGSHHYSGNFDADDPESLGAILSRERDLVVEHQGDEIVIRAR